VAVFTLFVTCVAGILPGLIKSSFQPEFLLVAMISRGYYMSGIQQCQAHVPAPRIRSARMCHYRTSIPLYFSTDQIVDVERSTSNSGNLKIRLPE